MKELLSVSSEITPPTLSQLLKLYSAYNFGGRLPATALAATLVTDKSLGAILGTTKHYTSLTGFWGYIAYKAVSQILESDRIDSQYKPLLYALFSGISAGMVFFGKDIFADQHDASKMLKSIALTSGFFDKNDTITGLEEAYNTSYLSGIKYTLTHLKQIVANKFILYTLGQQGLDVVRLVVAEKFLQPTPFDTISILLALKNGIAFKQILKLATTSLARHVVDATHQQLTNYLTNSTKKEIDAQIAALVFNDEHREIVMKTPQITQIPNQISIVFSRASSDLSAIIRELLMPAVSLKDHSTGQPTVAKILNTYPSLLLFEGLANTIFSHGNMASAAKAIRNKLFGAAAQTHVFAEDAEIVTQQLGSCTISSRITTTQYAYANIQEIVKSGGSQFILDKLLQVIQNSTSDGNINVDMITTTLVAILDLVKNIVYKLGYATQLLALRAAPEEISAIEYDIATTTGILGLQQAGADYTYSAATDSLDELSKILLGFKYQQYPGPTRETHTKISLVLHDYKLRVAQGKQLFSISELEFKPGIYAIIGPIGIGKTTILNDIMKCLSEAFISSGNIIYPCDSDGSLMPEIFCGNTPFGPPGTTVFERITYRLPESYREEHKLMLENRIFKLFSDFNQSALITNTLHTKCSNQAINLSTGQAKMTMIMGAIIYKEYLGRPVLLVLDETSANLDYDTALLVQSKIQEIFGSDGSIVLSVDHNARQFSGFYQRYVDLGSFKSSIDDHFQEEMAISGDLSAGSPSVLYES